MSAKANRKQPCLGDESQPVIDRDKIKECEKALRQKHLLVLNEPVPPKIAALIKHLRIVELSR